MGYVRISIIAWGIAAAGSAQEREQVPGAIHEAFSETDFREVTSSLERRSFTAPLVRDDGFNLGIDVNARSWPSSPEGEIVKHLSGQSQAIIAPIFYASFSGGDSTSVIGFMHLPSVGDASYAITFSAASFGYSWLMGGSSFLPGQGWVMSIQANHTIIGIDRQRFLDEVDNISAFTMTNSTADWQLGYRAEWIDITTYVGIGYSQTSAENTDQDEEELFSYAHTQAYELAGVTWCLPTDQLCLAGAYHTDTVTGPFTVFSLIVRK